MKHLLTSLILTFFVSLVFLFPSSTHAQLPGVMQEMEAHFAAALSGIHLDADFAPGSAPDQVRRILCQEGSVNQTVEHRAEWIAGECDNYDPQASAMGGISQGIAMVIKNQPASAGVYVADLMQRINPIEPAYAQGIGFTSLDPILPLWKATRNMANLFMVVVFIFVGFAIMFRYRLNPQTVVNIQNALPQLVITLLLINFSYAIVGLMIDIMYISMYLIFNVAINTVFTNGEEQTKLASAIFNQSFLRNSLRFAGDTRAAADLGQLIEDVLPDVGPLNDVVGAIAGVLAYLVLLVVITFNAFKVFFALLGAYIQIVLAVIFGPLKLLMNAYPGSQAFTSWIKGVAAHLAVFPVVISMLLILFALTGKYGAGDTLQEGGERSGFSPPQLTTSSPEGYNGLIALGIILTLPTIVDQTKKAMGAEGSGIGGDAFAGGALGGAIGGALANNPVTNTLRGTANMGAGIGTGIATNMATQNIATRMQRRAQRKAAERPVDLSSAVTSIPGVAPREEPKAGGIPRRSSGTTVSGPGEE